MHTPNIMNSSSTPLAEWEMKSQIQEALNDKLTGQIQIAFLNGRTESVFVQHGVVQSLYIRNHRLPDLNWETPVEHFGRGTLVIEPLPPSTIPFKRVATEEIALPPPTSSGTNQLKAMFSLAEGNLGATLFHIRWDKAEGFVLVAGGRIPIRRAVFITSLGAEEGNMAFDHISAWEEARCNVRIHRGDIKNQAWLELHLSILFEWYCENILNYYKQLTGVVMVRSILQNLLVLAGHKGWNISTQNQQLKDTSIFPSAADAGDAYREILSDIRSRIEPVIGSSLSEYLMKQSIEPTRGVYKTIQETFGLVEDDQ